MALLSLFSGCGGLDQGFRQAGFRTRLAFDINADCVKTFRYNHPDVTVVQADLREITVEDLDRLHGGEFRPVGVLGGPPCQSFSVANVRQTDDDDRHGLPDVYARLLCDLNRRHPVSFFLFENVPGLVGKKHGHRFARLLERFDAAGFEVHHRVLDAQWYGVPQCRRRVFVVGINRLLRVASAWNWPEGSARRLTVADAIGGLPAPVYYRRGLSPGDIPFHPNHWCLWPRSPKFNGAAGEVSRVRGRGFRRLAWDRPSWTVAYGHREVHLHPDGTRRISVFEAMRLQAFPFHYRLLGTLSAQVQMVSDAVPVELARRIAQAIGRTVGGTAF